MTEEMFYQIRRFYYYFATGIVMFFLTIFFGMMFTHSIVEAANIAWVTAWIVMPVFMTFMTVDEKKNPLLWVKRRIGL